jgi:eukaryotic-like serine/threonine-protein kinase
MHEDLPPLSSDGQDDEEVLSDTDPASTQGERRPLPAFPVLVGAFMMGGLFMALLVFQVRPRPEEPPPPWIATPEEVAQFAPDAGVGEEALTSVQAVPRVVLPPSYVGLRMPKEALPGQKKPPCAPGQRAINGGCWFGPSATLKPPCGPEAVEYDDGCYMPVFLAPRQPTSDTP